MVNGEIQQSAFTFSDIKEEDSDIESCLFLILADFLVVFPAYADILPPFPSPLGPKWLVYAAEAIVGETVAWLIGAESLRRLSRKRKQEVSRSESYKIMLLVMIVSFSIGLPFWKIFGWI